LKKSVKLYGLIVFAVLIEFLTTGCDDGSHTCSFGDWNVTTIAGCLTEGVETQTCNRSSCNESNIRSISELGHNFGSLIVTTTAGCTTEGVETGTCTRNNCNGLSTHSISALGHIFDNWIITTPASCTAGVETGTCTRNNCNETGTRGITSLGHIFGNWTVVTPASCTEGIQRGTCTRDGCNETDTRSITALGHNFGAWTITIQPTASSPGQERRTCQRSGCSHFETRSITAPTITIRNNTGYTIGGGANNDNGIWIKPSTEAQSWRSNLAWGFYNSFLYDGESRAYTISPPLSVNSMYDIRLDGSGFSFRKYGVTISNGMTIIFNTNDLNNGSAQPSITIQNRSGKAFNSVHIKPSVISDWGSSFGSISNNNNLSLTILIPPSNYTVFDIQMRSTNPTNTYTRNNVTISNGMTLTFTSADMDNPTVEFPVIVILNNTGYTVGGGATNDNGIWIKPSTSTSWGNNLAWGFSNSFLYDGESRAYTLSQHLSANRIYDIRLSGGGFNFIKNNITVTEGMILVFTTGDLQ